MRDGLKLFISVKPSVSMVRYSSSYLMQWKWLLFLCGYLSFRQAAAVLYAAGVASAASSTAKEKES